jgi:hypothetical protein
MEAMTYVLDDSTVVGKPSTLVAMEGRGHHGGHDLCVG